MLEIDTETYVNWCGVPVTVVGFDGNRVLAKSATGPVGDYDPSELGPVPPGGRRNISQKCGDSGRNEG